MMLLARYSMGMVEWALVGKRLARRPLIMPFIDWKTTTYQIDLK